MGFVKAVSITQELYSTILHFNVTIKVIVGSSSCIKRTHIDSSVDSVPAEPKLQSHPIPNNKHVRKEACR